MIAHQFQSRRGVALVIVLAMLVLMSGLMVAFISTATTERSASFANSGTISARQIADSTVNTVISELREATTTPDEGVTWASQPGAIRTFGGNLQSTRKPLRDGAYYQTFSGSPQDFVYKLYSADDMRVSASGGQISPFEDEINVIEGWDASNPPEEYVDLNRPVLLKLDSNGSDKASKAVYEPHYPIIDPRAMYKANEAENDGPEFGMVEGFDAKISKDGNLKLASGGAVPYIPMPVKWVYILRDGSMYTAKRLQENAGILKNNPVVGRSAWWTDDETCKLNINTASEGTYWDTPTASGVQEAGLLQDVKSPAAQITLGPNTNFNLAVAQPSRSEFQRYPGHPATTSLSPVFGSLPPWNITWDTSPYPLFRSGANYVNLSFKEAMYQIAPFIAYGKNTSIAATQKTDPDLIDAEGKRNVMSKHLYATVDELLFKSPRFSGSDSPEINTPDLKTAITPEALEKTRFFLTANSRAPETNLFSRPRVTIWPVNAQQGYRTHFDDLFGFASTIYRDNNPNNKRDFSILRYDAKSATNDYDGAPIKGQNKKMFQYLQKFTSNKIPGFGGSFSSKYGNEERDEILTQIFDYVRAVNLVDTGTASRTGSVFVPYTPRYFPAGYPEVDPNSGGYRTMPRSYDWAGQVVPLRVSDSAARDFQGQGRFFTVSEAALILYNAPFAGPPASPGIRACLVMEMTGTMPGFVGLRPTFYTRVRRMQERGEFSDVHLRVVDPASDQGFKPMGFSPFRLINICNVSPHEVTQGRAYIANMGFSSQLLFFTEHKGPTDPTNEAYWRPGQTPSKDPNRTNMEPTRSVTAKLFDNRNLNNVSSQYTRANSATARIYPYVSDVIPVPAGKSIQFKGGKFEIEIWAGEAPDDPRVQDPQDAEAAPLGAKGLVQVIQVEFPEVPTGNITPTTVVSEPRTRYNNLNAPDGNADVFPNTNDIVRSMELTTPQNEVNKQGDLRLAITRQLVKPEFFQPRGGLTSWQSASQRVHGLTWAHGDPLPGYVGNGRLAPNSGVRSSKPPALPATTNGVQRADGGPGDWDRGLSKHNDGAFSNKVDEGNTGFTYADGTVAARTPYYRGRSIDETGQTMFSPNRQLSSPVMFGSIPTGVVSNKPWQTLLFRPNRESGPGHPGAIGDAPDHLMLDLFNMPVVEPYAISEPLSTAGKVNLNYVIAPFGYAKGSGSGGMGTQAPRSYLRRDTALRGVLKPVAIMAVPTTQADGGHTETPSSNSVNFRFPVHMNRTIEEMETRLKDPQGSLFRSASEICTIDLYPVQDGRTQKENTPVNDWNTFWTSKGLTGDNMRERPYSLIYPRVTTKSNTYTVHMWCQAIRKSPTSDPAVFDPEKDQVFGEYRGSATIERFVDPNDAELKNYNPINEKIDRYYRYRIVSTKHFAPH